MKEIITVESLHALRLTDRDAAFALRDRLKRNADTLHGIYEAHIEDSVQITVDSLIKAIGYNAAVTTVADAITAIGTWDGRIYQRVRNWANENADVDKEMAEHLTRVDIHSAHMNQIADAMMHTARPATTTVA